MKKCMKDVSVLSMWFFVLFLLYFLDYFDVSSFFKFGEILA